MLLFIRMSMQIEATHISNTLNYLHLLPENERLNELNVILRYIKKLQRKLNKGIDYNPEYIKSLKRVSHLTFKKLQ